MGLTCRYCGGNCPNEPENSENLCDGFEDALISEDWFLAEKSYEEYFNDET